MFCYPLGAKEKAIQLFVPLKRFAIFYIIESLGVIGVVSFHPAVPPVVVEAVVAV